MGQGKGRRAALIAVALLAIVAVHDTFVPVRDAFGARTALYAIERYQAHVSPHLHGLVQCRFTPTCSHYGHEAIARYGLLKGGAKTIGRIARCGPWSRMGTFDPP